MPADDRFLLPAVFLAGAGTLAIEMVMPRLLAPFFGTSQPIWAVVIGLTLAYLALGYHLGGRLADRQPEAPLLYRLIALAGLLTSFVPLVARPILSFAQSALHMVAAGGFVAALLGVLLIFSAPVILLAMVSPFAVRLQLRRAETGVAAAGRAVGSISALSTIGSIIGTFVPVLLLIPMVGTNATIYLIAALLLAVGALGLRDWRYGLLLLLPLALAFASAAFAPSIKAADCRDCRLLAEAESSYNYIQIAEQEMRYSGGTTDLRRVLILNEGQAIHSLYRLKYERTGDPLDLLTDGGPWDYFAVAPYLYPARDEASIKTVAMLGSAAGTVPKQLLAIYGPAMQIDAVEIDPAISAIGRRFFALEDRNPAFPNYTTYADDARAWLAKTPRSYDLIGLDAYHQPYIPFHLTTVEFFREVRAHLNEGGVAVVNAGRPRSGDERLVEALGTTMLAVFPEVYIIDTRFSNALLVGVRDPVGDGAANFAANAASVRAPALQLVMYWALNEGRVGPVRRFVPSAAHAAPFTDDHAPIERLIHGLILNEALR